MTPTDNIVPVPYELHTDRELEFMLERGKPLAHFSDACPSEPDEEIVPELAAACGVWRRVQFHNQEALVRHPALRVENDWTLPTVCLGAGGGQKLTLSHSRYRGPRSQRDHRMVMWDWNLGKHRVL